MGESWIGSSSWSNLHLLEKNILEREHGLLEPMLTEIRKLSFYFYLYHQVLWV